MFVLKRGIAQLRLILHLIGPNIKFIMCYLGGRQEDVHFDKITSRIQKLCYGLNMDFVDPVSVLLLRLLRHN